MTQNKTHWYDGWFYDTVIAPNQDQLFWQIKTFIEPQSKVLDDGSISKTIEFLAGREHYRNYKTYMAKGGIHYLAHTAGLKIIDEIKNRPSASHIAILMK